MGTRSHVRIPTVFTAIGGTVEQVVETGANECSEISQGVKSIPIHPSASAEHKGRREEKKKVGRTMGNHETRKHSKKARQIEALLHHSVACPFTSFHLPQGRLLDMKPKAI